MNTKKITCNSQKKLNKPTCEVYVDIKIIFDATTTYEEKCIQPFYSKI